MLELFYSSGLRLSELVGANLRVSMRQRSPLGKSGKIRLIPVGRLALAIAADFNDVRATSR